MKLKSLLASGVIAVVVALIAPTTMFANAAEGTPFDYSNFDLGEGTPAYLDVELAQNGVKDDALAAIKKWRQDALDTGVKWPDPDGVPMREYLKDQGISEADYLKPQWSTNVEMIAIQRAVEVYSAGIHGHGRPAGGTVFIEHDGIRGNSEVIAWGDTSAAQAVDHWATEKTYWVGKTDGETGHYEHLIDPTCKQYGIAGVDRRWVGQAICADNPGPSSDTQTAGTNLKGTYSVQVKLGDVAIANGVKIDVQDIIVGRTATATVTSNQYVGSVTDPTGTREVPMRFPADRFTFRGTWTSDDASIAAVSESGAVTGVKAGTTTVHLTTENGKVFDFPITVTEEPTPEPTEEPTEEPAPAPSEEPSQEPSEAPTEEPTVAPTQEPTEEPTVAPTEEPAPAPSEEPTQEPTQEPGPTEKPSQEPTEAPKPEPTVDPTVEPSQAPSEKPTVEPSEAPSEKPAPVPSQEPTEAPTEEPAPEPTAEPTVEPTQAPSEEPSQAPAPEPTVEPSEQPSQKPSEAPTQAPEPTVDPTMEPTQAPSEAPGEEQPGEEPGKDPSQKPNDPAKPGESDNDDSGKPDDKQTEAPADVDEGGSDNGANNTSGGSSDTGSSNSNSLPRTGASVLPIGLTAGVLVAAGVALLVAARRRS